VDTRIIRVPAVKDKRGLRVKPDIPHDYVVLEWSADQKTVVIRLFGKREDIGKVVGEEVAETYPRTPHRIIGPDGTVIDSDDETEIGTRVS